jgi:hypothetical protein
LFCFPCRKGTSILNSTKIAIRWYFSILFYPSWGYYTSSTMAVAAGVQSARHGILHQETSRGVCVPWPEDVAAVSCCERYGSYSQYMP